MIGAVYKERIFLKLFLDIETLPAAGKDLAIIKELYLEQKKKSGKNKEISTFDSYFRGTSFSGEFGRIFCIGYAIDDRPVECLSGDEKGILEKFWKIAEIADLFIGHNIIEFDLRFIYKRSIIHNIRPSQNLNFARYRSSPIFDTMKEWEKWGSQGASLHRLSLALGFESSKSEGIDGSLVYDFFLAGKTDEICRYCKRDVEVTRKIYDKMNFIN